MHSLLLEKVELAVDDLLQLGRLCNIQLIDTSRIKESWIYDTARAIYFAVVLETGSCLSGSKGTLQYLPRYVPLHYLQNTRAGSAADCASTARLHCQPLDPAQNSTGSCPCRSMAL